MKSVLFIQTQTYEAVEIALTGSRPVSISPAVFGGWNEEISLSEAKFLASFDTWSEIEGALNPQRLEDTPKRSGRNLIPLM